MSDAWKENLNNKLPGFGGQAAKYFYSALRLSIFMTIPMGIGIMLWGTTAIELLAGKNYICPELKYLFLIMSPLVVIMPLAKMFQFTINLNNKTKIVGISILIASLLNLVLNILLIPRYGLIGAAAATSFSYTLLFISSIILSSARSNFKFSQLKFVQILISAIVMSITVFIVRYFVDADLSTYFHGDKTIPRIFIEAPLAGMAYCLCSLKLKVWKISELTGK
jgi:O-antigen/teichoic acid export membrane protein